MKHAKELMPSIENFIAALAYSYHVDSYELFISAARMCDAVAAKQLASDPSRNK